MVQKTTASTTIVENLSTIVGLICLAIVAVGYFVKGGVTESTWLRNVTSYAIPFVTILTVVMMLRRYIVYVVEREPGEWNYALTSLVVTIVFLILGLVQSPSGPTYRPIFLQISAIGTIAIVSMIAFGIASAMFRRFVVRSPITTFVIIVSFIGFLTFSPLGKMIFPPVVDLGEFVQAYIAGAADSAYWLAAYIGSLALVTRLIMLKESFKPKTGVKA